MTYRSEPIPMLEELSTLSTRAHLLQVWQLNKLLILSEGKNWYHQRPPPPKQTHLKVGIITVRPLHSAHYNLFQRTFARQMHVILIDPRIFLGCACAWARADSRHQIQQASDEKEHTYPPPPPQHLCQHANGSVKCKLRRSSLACMSCRGVGPRQSSPGLPKVVQWQLLNDGFMRMTVEHQGQRFAGVLMPQTRSALNPKP